MPELWNRDIEKKFFVESMRNFSTPEQLFYVTSDDRYLAYWPKGYKDPKTTLQSRNSLIGNFTEKWTTDLIQEAVGGKGLFAVQKVVCEDIQLTKRSPADVVISKSRNKIQRAQDIVAILEVKMSVVWNWELKNRELLCLGDYKTHQGNPGLLRSDSMLKAIGKSISIRVSSFKASPIPIIILGNTPITNFYYAKVDHLIVAGIIQGFWSVNPRPLDTNTSENIKQTAKLGFYKFDEFSELRDKIDFLISEERSFFSSMKTKNELGRIIELANREDTYEKKAEAFLRLLKE